MLKSSACLRDYCIQKEFLKDDGSNLFSFKKK
jgi:hypothetical protein